jgi:tetratricopeptide (TPR) repeat protein
MSEEERNSYNAQEIAGLVRRYEEMASEGRSYFFDLDEFEAIIEYYVEQGDFEAGSGVIRYASELFPSSTILMLREAQMLAGNGQVSKALSKLKNLLAFEPHNEEIYLSLASIYSQIHDHSQAVYYFKEALKYAEDDILDDVYIDIALEYENLGDFEKAIVTLKEALARNPENETAIHELAYCFEMTAELDECVHYYQAFIDRFPYSYTSWYNLGNAYIKLEKNDLAIEAFDYCLAIDENFAPAHFNRAMAYINAERYEEAIEDLIETLRAESPQASTYCYVGECFEKLSKLDEARNYYRLAVEADPEFAEAYVGLGVICDLEFKFREALEFFRKAAALEEESPDYMFLLAEALRKCDLNEEAREVYDRIISIDPYSDEAWLEYADLISSTEGIHAALALIEQGIANLPDDIALRYRKVAYLHRLGKKQEAYVLLHELLPENSGLSNELTDYYPDIQQDPTYLDLC